jgi:hypothetical protein
MKSQDNISAIFVNTVVGRGILNNVLNLSFGTFNFTPNEATGEVELDPVVSCRLRMDKTCAIQLRDTMIQFLKDIEEAEAKIVNPNTTSERVLPKTSGTSH